MKTPLLAGLVAAAFLFAGSTAARAEKPAKAAQKKYTWTVGHGEGDGCWSANQRKGGAKFCHNCLEQQGKHVRWNFPLLCNGKDTGKVAKVNLDCSGREGNLDETKQQERLRGKVTLPKTTRPCP